MALPAVASGSESQKQRAAALVLAIGSGKAGTVLDHMSPREVEALAEEVQRLGGYDQKSRRMLIEAALNHIRSIDPMAEAEALRLRARQMQMAAELAEFEEFDPNEPFKFLQKVELDQVVQFLRSEHPQTVAVILAAQPPVFAAKILGAIDDELAGDISLRIATIGRTPTETIIRIERAIRRRLTEAEEYETALPDGAKDLAAILNNADRDLEGSMLEHIAEHDQQLAERVRSLMFVFEDIVTLEDRAIQQILSNVNTATLAMALKGADEVVKEAVLRNLSERAREALVEEIDLLGAVRKQDVSDARTAVVAQIRALEAAGTIVINRGEEGELIE